MVKLYYQTGSLVRQTFRALRETFGQHDRCKEDTVCHKVIQFETTGLVVDHPLPDVEMCEPPKARNRGYRVGS